MFILAWWFCFHSLATNSVKRWQPVSSAVQFIHAFSRLDYQIFSLAVGLLGLLWQVLCACCRRAVVSSSVKPGPYSHLGLKLKFFVPFSYYLGVM